MKKIIMIGPYGNTVLPEMRAKTQGRFEVESVPDYDQYDRLRDADYIVLRTLKLDRAAIQTLSKAKLIHRWGVGFDSVDIEAAGEAGIQVAITAGVNAAAVSEMAVGHMLNVYRHISTMNAMVKRGLWERQSFIDTSYTIRGKIVGLLGCGNIGRLVAEKVRAFGAEVIYYDLFRMDEAMENRLGIRYVDLDTLVRTCDILSVHVPATEETRGMVNAFVFERMKPTSILINTARGTIVNEADLVEALNAKTILGAGLDCVAEEPIQPDSALAACENVVITPHVGGNTCDVGTEMIRCILNNIDIVDAGGRIGRPCLVNEAYLKGV